MTFRDERDAQRERIEMLERALADAERARDEAERALGASDEERRAAQLARTRFPRGSQVLVEWGGKWWKATVLEVLDVERWRIHYDGWSARWDEIVGPERIHARDAAPPGPLAGESGPLAPMLVVGVVLVLAALLVFLLAR